MHMHKIADRSDESALSESLTLREVEILQMAGRGLSMKGIGQRLGIASGTVSWHLKNAYQKLEAGGREEALEKARAMAIIEVAGLCRNCACELERSRESLVSLRPGAIAA